MSTEQSMKFIKKPVTIEATQWFSNGDHPLDYSRNHDGTENGELRVFTAAERKANKWEGDIVRYFRRPDVSGKQSCKHCGKTMHEHGWIETLEGGHIVCPGDWIITGVQGEHYPCKPDIFEATYSPAARVHIKALPAARAPADSVQEDAARESEYRRGYRHGYEQRDAEVRGAMA